MGSDTYQCMNCGAALKYKPGTTSLHCDYCETDTPIEAKVVDDAIELDFEQYVQQYQNLNTQTTKIINCHKCGAESTFDENLKSTKCLYCGTPLIESSIHEERLIQPSYLLPFKVTDKDLQIHLTTWLKSLWWAPNKLKKRAMYTNKLQGVYIPCWTYDTQTKTNYTGQRGKNYTTTTGTGKNKRTVTRTSWSNCSGQVSLYFDDVLVTASKLISVDTMSKIHNWDMMNMVEVNDRFLSGFVTEKYIMNLSQGFDIAKTIMDRDIDIAIKQDIGGDEQRISSKDTRYSNIKFKLILLPVYMSSYNYGNKLYHFFVNGRTGRVTGDRPYSAIKITLAIIGVITVIILFYILSKNQ